MSDYLDFQRDKITRKLSYIIDVIEAARRSKAPWMDLSRQGLTQLPESIGQLRCPSRVFGGGSAAANRSSTLRSRPDDKSVSV